MKKPITPDAFDAMLVSVVSGVMLSVCLVFALHLFSSTEAKRDRAFSTTNFAQVFRSPF